MKIKNIGIPSLMMIFLTLALMMFAALSLSVASNDKTYSEKNASHKKAYYEASNKSEMMLNEIDDILMEAYSASPNNAEFYKAALSKIENNGAITGNARKFETNVHLISWQIPINDNSSLAVEIEITSPADNPDGEFYRILKWQSIQNPNK